MSVVKPAQGRGRSVTGWPSRMPTARYLWRSGQGSVSRPPTTAAPRSSSRLAQPTVWLPALVYDFKLITMAWNLLPREYEEQSN